MSVSFNSAPLLLTDEQMRQYIVDGYVMLEPSVPDELHETIRRETLQTFWTWEAIRGTTCCHGCRRCGTSSTVLRYVAH